VAALSFLGILCLVMDSDSTAIISDGGPPAEQSQTIQALTNPPDWPARLKMFSKRCAAGLVDLLIMSTLSLFFLGLPLLASMAFSVWEPAASPIPTHLSSLIEHSLQLAAVITLLNQLYFYTALAESSPAQASLGKILLGIKTTDGAGVGQTFAGVFRRLNVKYCLFIVLCIAANAAVNFAADFIPSLQIEQLRTLMTTVIVAASFALCIVTDREQNLYDVACSRMVVVDGTGGAKERLRRFANEMVAVLMTLNPFKLVKKCKVGTTDGKVIGTADCKSSGTVDGRRIVTALLAFWTYMSTAATIIFVVFACRIGLSMSEVESGIKAQSRQETDQAAQHFKKALSLSPGFAVIYQYYYMLNDNLDLTKQDAACARLFAVRGNAQDYLARARVRAKQQHYQPSESDYTEALSGRHGGLDPREADAAQTELAMIKLEAEAASMPNSPPQLMHTNPIDFEQPDSRLRSHDTRLK
jgi:uncharacterized RDD family membrane protein YckC